MSKEKRLMSICPDCAGTGVSRFDCICHGGGRATKECSPCYRCEATGEIPYIPEQPTEQGYECTFVGQCGCAGDKEYCEGSFAKDSEPCPHWQPKKPVEPTCPERVCKFCGKPDVDWDEDCDGEGFHEAADLQPERQVSRDFDTIEHEAEMPIYLLTDDKLEEFRRKLREGYRWDCTVDTFNKCLKTHCYVCPHVIERPPLGKPEPAERPLRSQFYKILSRMDKPTWCGGIDWNEALNWMVLITEAHDSAVAAKAIAEFAEKVRKQLFHKMPACPTRLSVTEGIPSAIEDIGYIKGLQQALSILRAMAEE
jgi:hypothetical protein